MNQRKFTTPYIILPLGFLLIFINLLILDFQLFRNSKTVVVQSATQTIAPTSTPNVNFNCNDNCLAQIETRIKKDNLLQNQNQTKSVQTPTPQQTTNTQGAKEFYIQFGGGLSAAGDWQDVSGLQSYIDSTSYPDIKTVVFEASVHLPTTNETVDVRLFDVTDQHPVWLSDVTYNSDGSPQLLISKPLSLDMGNKLYQVQMKTQLQAPASLDQSRIHITLY